MRNTSRVFAPTAVGKHTPAAWLVKLCALLHVVLIIVGLWVNAQAQTQPPTYTITDLGTLIGGTYSVGRATNSAGQVVGRADDAGGNDHAFSWRNGVITDLGLLPGGTYADAFAVNASDQSAGEADDNSGLSHPVLWQNGLITDLGIPAGINSAHAQGINENGQVVGYGDDGGGQRAFLWQGGTVIDLGTLLGGNGSVAWAINDSGQVVGGSGHAFLWQNGVMTDLGTLPGSRGGAALSINSTGQVVGTYYLEAGPQRAFHWQNGVMTDLGTLSDNGLNSSRNTLAHSINAIGQIVGSSEFTTLFETVPHAVIWDGGVLTDLNTLIPASSGWVLYGANSINDAGQITGEGTINGQSHSFLLTPLTQTPAQAISGLISQAATLSLTDGNQSSLTTKLRSAQAAFARGNSTAAANNLQATINEIQALKRSRRLAPQTADALTGTIRQIIGRLE
jgi:probable HAF family extracellular repeat protein